MCLSGIRSDPSVWGRPTLTRGTRLESSTRESTWCNAYEPILIPVPWITFRFGYTSIKGSARFASSDTLGELIVSCKFQMWILQQCHLITWSVGNGDGGSRANYRVVATDYTSYAIVYDCKEKLFIGKKGELFYNPVHLIMRIVL